MDVTTMVSTDSLSKTLKERFPSITFEASDHARWNPTSRTVFYVSSEDDQDIAELLHELGHATLHHEKYDQDIELLKLERAAWDDALKVAADMDIEITADTIEEHLNSYREWMHARSRCPRCQQAGIQEKSDNGTYRCPLCNTAWRVNEAKTCGLKRYVNTKTSA